MGLVRDWISLGIQIHIDNNHEKRKEMKQVHIKRKKKDEEERNDCINIVFRSKKKYVVTIITLFESYNDSINVKNFIY